MGKERLEEIKREYKKDVYDCKLGRFDIDWLIEQAERVEWLVENRKVLEDELHEARETGARIYEQNKRYREGLKNLYLSICKGGKYDERINKQVAFNIIMDIEKIDDDLRDELNKALESESE